MQCLAKSWIWFKKCLGFWGRARALILKQLPGLSCRSSEGIAQGEGTNMHSSVLAPSAMPPGRGLVSELAPPPGIKVLTYPHHLPVALP